MIFLFRRIKCELRVVGENIPLLLFSAFLCCIGGILMWVSGGSTWYAIRSAFDPWMTLSLSGIFIVWLLCYGLVGILLGLIWISCKARACNSGLCLKSFALVMAVYLLMLSWYAVFFCTRLLLFAVVLLTISIILCFIVFVTMRKTLLLISAVTVIIEIIQIYFVWFSFNAYR